MRLPTTLTTIDQGMEYNMNGEVAAVMIYNRVLTDAEITEIYTYFRTRFSFP